MLKTKKTLHILIIFAVIAVNLFFGLSRIVEYTAVDETLWSYGRVPKFWQSVKDGNWRGTNLCDKPGVVLAMISGIGLPFSPDPKDYEDLQHRPKTTDQINSINDIYLHLRFPVYLFSLMSLFSFYFLLKRLLGPDVAIFSVIFIGLSPILLGISLIINTDAVLWILMPSCILSFLIYQKENNKKFLYLAAVILGMGILTKFVANLLFPFIFFLILLKFIAGEFSNTEHKILYFKKAIEDYLVFMLIAFLTIFVLYPSAWIKPRELLNVTIYSQALAKMWPLFVTMFVAVLFDTYALKSIVMRKICGFFSDNKQDAIKLVSFLILLLMAFVMINVYLGMPFFDFEKIIANAKPDAPLSVEFIPKFVSSYYPLIYGLIPMVAILFIWTLFLMTRITTDQIKKSSNLLHGFYLILFILIYYLGNSVARISSTVRYQIVIYPIASIIAAIGFYEIVNSKIVKDHVSKKLAIFLIALVATVPIISLFQIKPFFLAYSSDLLPNRYILNLRDDMGDGSWEVSQYLNSLPNAKSLAVWSDKKQVCEKFIGRCKTGFRVKDFQDIQFDYFVSSIGGMEESEMKKRKMTLDLGMQTVSMEKLYSNGDSYVFKITTGGNPGNFIAVSTAESAVVANDEHKY